MKIKSILNEEIQSQIESLNDIEMGTDNYKNSVDGITKLTGQLIEIEKLEKEREDKFDDNTYRAMQLDEERKDRKVRNCIAAAGVIIPTIVTIWGTKASFKFEQEGTITTIMGRGFINKLLPKK